MLFEKIQLMVERHVDKKQRIVKSEPAGRSSRDKPQKSNKYLDEYYEFNSMKICYKRIVSLINQTYKQMRDPEPGVDDSREKSPKVEVVPPEGQRDLEAADSP